jgi:hypothetical protein
MIDVDENTLPKIHASVTQFIARNNQKVVDRLNFESPDRPAVLIMESGKILNVHTHRHKMNDY